MSLGGDSVVASTKSCGQVKRFVKGIQKVDIGGIIECSAPAGAAMSREEGALLSPRTSHVKPMELLETFRLKSV